MGICDGFNDESLLKLNVIFLTFTYRILGQLVNFFPMHTFLRFQGEELGEQFLVAIKLLVNYLALGIREVGCFPQLLPLLDQTCAGITPCQLFEVHGWAAGVPVHLETS